MDDEILREFLAESRKHLGRLNTDLLALGEDPGNARLRASVSQTFHNLKETCGFLGLTPLVRVAQSAEKLLKLMPEGAGGTGSGLVGGETIARVQQAVDQLKEMLRGLAETESAPVSLDSRPTEYCERKTAQGTGDRFLSADWTDEATEGRETFAETPASPEPHTLPSQSQQHPLTEETGPIAEKPRPEDEQRDTLAVLVIDESVFFRQWAALTLEAAGFEVASCSSYRDAMRRMNQGESYAAILGERNLPGLSGSEFAAWMASRPRSALTPLIAVSSPLEETNAEVVPSDAFHRVLEKFDSQELVRAVREAAAETSHLATRS